MTLFHIALVATEYIEQGGVVHKIQGRVSPLRTKTSLEVYGQHVEDEFLQFLNHSCDPNTYIIGNKLLALDDIVIGEQLTIDYHDNEMAIAYPFECRCGKWGCRGIIR